MSDGGNFLWNADVYAERHAPRYPLVRAYEPVRKHEFAHSNAQSRMYNPIATTAQLRDEYLRLGLAKMAELHGVGRRNLRRALIARGIEIKRRGRLGGVA